MTKIIGLFSFVAACFYGLTVIALYGYNSYFNIPYNFIEYSPIYPIVFFFNLLRITQSVFAHSTFWGILGFAGIVAILSIVFFSGRIGRWLVSLLLMCFVIWLPFGFYNFGHLVASKTTYFYTAPSTCIPGATSTSIYIAPTIYEGQAVFVPVATGTLKLQNGLLARSTSDVCELKMDFVGKIVP